MRLSFITTTLLSAIAFTTSGTKAEAADLIARSPNALPAPVPAALPIANAVPAAAPIAAGLDPMLHALIERSLEECRLDLSSIAGLVSDLDPTLQAVL
jgi:hypothetical protein